VRKTIMIAAGAAVAGLAALGGTAFTGTGLGNSAPATQFIGGTVSQSVTGATLDSVDYGFADDPAHTQVSSIQLTFSNTADGRTVAATPHGNSANGGTFGCTAVASNASTCSYTPGSDTLPGYSGLTSLDVTVS
jgi:hypothetical protein